MATGTKLAGKVAIVTGAGSSGPGVGTGKAISVLLAGEGAQVVLVDKFEDRAQETLSLIEEDGGEAIIVTVDLSQRGSADEVASASVSAFGGIDILVNNAAVPSSTNILDTSDELYDLILAVNLTAPFMLTRASLPSMVERGGGSIVNVISIAALRGQGSRGQAAYAASKAGLTGLMIDIADTFGKQGVRANCVAPGIIDTPMRDASIRSAGLDPATLDLTFKTALPFEGDAWDIARATLFLAGPDGRFITGVVLPVDGGTTAMAR